MYISLIYLSYKFMNNVMNNLSLKSWVSKCRDYGTWSSNSLPDFHSLFIRRSRAKFRAPHTSFSNPMKDVSLWKDASLYYSPEKGKLETTIRYHCLPPKWLKWKRLPISSVDKKMEQLELLDKTDGNIKFPTQPLWEKIWKFLIKLNIHLP